MTALASTTAWAKRRPGPRRAARIAGVQLLLWLYAGIAFGPILLVIFGSLRPTQQILAHPLGVPRSLDLSNFGRAWTTASVSTYFLNSLLVTVSAVALCLIVSVMAAYPLARWRFRGAAVLSAYFLSGLMLPAKLGVLPIFYMFQSLHLIDSRLGLVLLYAAGGVPFSIFVIMAFIRNLPRELEEAARIDGAGELRVFFSVLLPLVRPAIAAVTVFQFAPTWNDFFFPLVLLRSQQKYTIPVGLTRFFGEYSTDRGALYAGLLLALLPLVILFVLATKQIVAGLTAGVTK
jgi:raffinose/stachyose/melibiose transport system permease protein